MVFGLLGGDSDSNDDAYDETLYNDEASHDPVSMAYSESGHIVANTRLRAEDGAEMVELTRPGYADMFLVFEGDLSKGELYGGQVWDSKAVSAAEARAWGNGMVIIPILLKDGTQVTKPVKDRIQELEAEYEAATAAEEAPEE